MDVEILSRLQFALTACFHFLFPPISIGFSLYIVAVEAMWLKTGNIKYLNAAKFFLKLFGMIFAVPQKTLRRKPERFQEKPILKTGRY